MAKSGSKTVAVTQWNNLVFSWSVGSQSTTNNTSFVRWELNLTSGSSGQINSTASKAWSVTVNGEKYSGTNTIGISNNSTKTLATGSTTIKHNDDGTKTFDFSFSQEFSITFSGSTIRTVSGSGSGTLDTIARKSTLSANNGALGTAQTLTVTRQSTSFTHTITYKCGNASGTIATKSTSTSINWTPDLSLASQNTTGTSVSVTFTITTYNSSGTSIGSNTKTITCAMPANVKPSCSVTVTDANGHTDTYGAYVKGLSKFKVTVSGVPSYGSDIVSYSTTANGSKYTSASFTTGVLGSHGTLTVSSYVTDKRGRTSTAASKQFTVLNYTAPSISNLTVGRCNQDGTANMQGEYVQVTFSASVTSLNSKNTANYTLKYKRPTDSDFTSVALSGIKNQYSVSNYGYIFKADADSSYVIEVSAQDNHGTASRATTVSTAFTLIHYGKDGTSIGFGKLAEYEGLMDIGLKVRMDGGILPPVLPPETDLNDVRTPNTYIGGDLSDYNYSNCPIESGTFTLEVDGAGELGQVKQRIQTCSKANSKAFERYYHTNAWGSWFCVSDFSGTLLWEGSNYMTSTQTINLSSNVSKQKSGIVLVFVEYISGAVGNSAFQTFFIPKMQVANHQAKGYTFILATSAFSYVASKYLYITDATITGHSDNNKTGTSASGLEYTNNRFVLRYVIGV